MYTYTYIITLSYVIVAVNHRIMMTETEAESVTVIEGQTDQIV